MDSGASKQENDNDALFLATPGSMNLPTSTHTDNAQPQMPVQDQRFSFERDNEDIKEQVSVARANTDWKASANDTLKRYRAKFPDQAVSLETMLYRLQALKNFVDSNLSRPDEYFRVTTQTIGCLCETSIDIWKSAGTPEADQFSTLLDFTIEVGGAEVLKRFVQHCLKQSYLFKKESNSNASGADKDACLLAKRTSGIILNFTDFHNGFCLACANAGVIPMCLENIKRIDAENSNWEEGEDSLLVKIIANLTEILYNIARRLRDREPFANSEETLLYFAKKKPRAIAADSLLTLAYIVDENTNHLILADENLLSFIITLLDEAWKSKHRRSTGLYSAKKLAEGLSHLAINDTNKKILGKKGAVRVLISVIKTSRENAEKASATKALWRLAFDDNNKEAIRQEDGAMELLHQLQQSKDSQVQEAAAGALWELEEKTARKAVRIKSTRNHVMISYQWDSQDVMVEVKNRLQASGYRVWMDLEQMGGSTLEAMAKAVENSSVVLVCVSERYKESQNCRSEAEYAYQLRKDIIPLMMQPKYRGDGWLGMLVGTKLWFDFQNKQAIEPGVAKLIKELGGRGKDVEVTDGPPEPKVRRVQADVVAATPSSPGVSAWTNTEVKQWLKEIGLEKVCHKEEISEMNGQTLIDLQELREEYPEYFYKCLERDLNLTNMLNIFKFTKGLRKLLGH